MITEETIIKKILPAEGYLLTDGEIITDCLFMAVDKNPDVWWEIPDPNYVPEFDGTDFLRPITWVNGMEIIDGLWYSDGIETWEAIKNGIPRDFTDKEYFDIID